MRIERRNKVVICLNYGFSGMNYLIGGIASLGTGTEWNGLVILVGVLLLAMVPITVADHRKEMYGKFAVVVAIIMHILLSLGISYLYLSWRLLLISVIESTLLALAFTYRRNKRK